MEAPWARWWHGAPGQRCRVVVVVVVVVVVFPRCGPPPSAGGVGPAEAGEKNVGGGRPPRGNDMGVPPSNGDAAYKHVQAPTRDKLIFARKKIYVA